MTISFSFSSQDGILLRTPAIRLSVALVSGTLIVMGALNFRASQHSALQTARAGRERQAAALLQVKEEKQTIEHHINQYREFETNGLMEEENRLALIEAINQIRMRYKLYPVKVEIEPQRPAFGGASQQGYESPSPELSSGIGLRSSQVKITLPLLHEEDLSHFLEELQKFRGMFVVNACTIERTASALSFDKAGLEANLDSTCHLLWLSLPPSTTSRLTGGQALSTITK